MSHTTPIRIIDSVYFYLPETYETLNKLQSTCLSDTQIVAQSYATTGDRLYATARKKQALTKNSSSSPSQTTRTRPSTASVQAPSDHLLSSPKRKPADYYLSEECTFSPLINEDSKKIAQKLPPSKAHLAFKEGKTPVVEKKPPPPPKKDAECTFTPKLISQTTSPQSAGARNLSLYEQAPKYRAKQEITRQRILKEEKESLPFSPNTKNTKSTGPTNKLSFEQRQTEFFQQKERRLSKIKAEVEKEEAEKTPFSPQIIRSPHRNSPAKQPQLDEIPGVKEHKHKMDQIYNPPPPPVYPDKRKEMMPKKDDTP
ncbi:hypothetical protein BLNAU_19648 [Blattamonas nauphoetae]|uniref:Uncharacterized protein n=1 Tax=Blattamonas nauphoetae TaxID=2049346 RepID=A0ABQ9X463_9EUKA|nr:hypothetical protein BLNAU_19648 [Blattamonas nauphoetae]